MIENVAQREHSWTSVDQHETHYESISSHQSWLWSRKNIACTPKDCR